MDLLPYFIFESLSPLTHGWRKTEHRSSLQWHQNAVEWNAGGINSAECYLGWPWPVGNHSHINYRFSLENGMIFWVISRASEVALSVVRDLLCWDKILAAGSCERDMQGLESTLPGAGAGRNNWIRNSFHRQGKCNLKDVPRVTLLVTGSSPRTQEVCLQFTGFGFISSSLSFSSLSFCKSNRL